MNINNILQEELKDTLSGTPADYTLQRTKTGFQGNFKIKDNKYIVKLFNDYNINKAKPKNAAEGIMVNNEPAFLIEFYLFDKEVRVDNTGTGNVSKVFSTVLKIMKEVIDKEKPNAIILEMPEQKNKGRLYKKFILRAGEFISGYSGKRFTDKVYGIIKK